MLNKEDLQEIDNIVNIDSSRELTHSMYFEKLIPLLNKQNWQLYEQNSFKNYTKSFHGQIYTIMLDSFIYPEKVHLSYKASILENSVFAVMLGAVADDPYLLYPYNYITNIFVNLRHENTVFPSAKITAQLIEFKAELNKAKQYLQMLTEDRIYAISQLLLKHLPNVLVNIVLLY